MFSILILLFSNVQSQSVCLWGAFNNPAINGEYTQYTILEGKQTYKLNPELVCDPPYYLWYQSISDKWYITHAEPGTSSAEWYGRCALSGSNDHPLTDCVSGKWEIGNWGIDSAVSIINGPCPEWECDALKVVATVENSCTGDYYVKTGPNTWSTSDNDWYWSFFTAGFYWSCDTQNTCTSCDACDFHGKTLQGWADLSGGENALLPVYHSSANPVHYYVYCISNPGPPFSITAAWSSTYEYVNINIINNDEGIEGVELRANEARRRRRLSSSSTGCDRVFDEDTVDIIGDSSVCSWSTNPSIDTDSHDISIYSLDSTIELTSSLAIAPGAFEYRYSDSDEWHVLNETVTIQFIQEAVNPVKPEISTNVTEFLSVCDPLVLDASSTANLGGRDGDFYWRLVGSNDTVGYTGSAHTFEWNEINTDINYMLSLNVTSWFQQTSSKEWSVYKDNKLNPDIHIDAVDGEALFSTTDEVFVGEVVLKAQISFDDMCLENNMEIISYRLDWNATCDVCSNIEDIRKYLNNITAHDPKADVISFWSQDYIEDPAVYEFSVTMSCLGNFECSVTCIYPNDDGDHETNLQQLLNSFWLIVIVVVLFVLILAMCCCLCVCYKRDQKNDTQLKKKNETQSVVEDDSLMDDDDYRGYD